jgi:hypothetical protein
MWLADDHKERRRIISPIEYSTVSVTRDISSKKTLDATVRRTAIVKGNILSLKTIRTLVIQAVTFPGVIKSTLLKRCEVALLVIRLAPISRSKTKNT